MPVTGITVPTTLRIANAPPYDDGYGVFFICLLHGMASFAPWNMFAAVTNFYFIGYKLNSINVNGTHVSAIEYKAWQEGFTVRMATAALASNIVFTIINCLIQIGHGRLGIRVSVSLLLMVACFIVNIFVAITDMSGAFQLYIYLTLSVMILLSGAHGIYNSSIWAIISQLPIDYSNALVIGNNLIGICTTLFVILFYLFTPQVKITTALFFLTGVVIVLLAFATYFVLTIKRFYRYYVQHLEIAEIQCDNPSVLQIWKEHWINFLDIFVTYFVTYLIYPNVAMGVDLTSDETFFKFDETFYSLIFCILTFNVVAFIGNLIPTFLKKPGPRFLWILAYLRILFIPLFALLNYTKEGRSRRFPVFLESAWYFWGAMMLFALTHGYVSSLAMMYPPKLFDSKPGTKAAMLATIFLVLGVSTGLACSLGFEKILLQ